MSNNRHKVFLSYHHSPSDQIYREKFENLFESYADIYVSRSVNKGDIEENIKNETVWQKIRDNHLRDSSVTIVLIGKETWKRKFVDWEIGSSIRHTKHNHRSGLLGIFLPTYPLYNGRHNPYTIPPRLHDNVECGFAKLYGWTNNSDQLKTWIHEAFLNRNKINPNNSRPLFANNRSSSATKWQ